MGRDEAWKRWLRSDYSYHRGKWIWPSRGLGGGRGRRKVRREEEEEEGRGGSRRVKGNEWKGESNREEEEEVRCERLKEEKGEGNKRGCLEEEKVSGRVK